MSILKMVLKGISHLNQFTRDSQLFLFDSKIELLLVAFSIMKSSSVFS